MSPLDWSIVAASLVVVLGVGAAVSVRITRFKDYFLAGGALTTPLLICSLVSTYYELDVTIATSERAFHDGLVAWTWEARPYYVAILLAALILPGRLRAAGVATIPELLERRYGLGARIAGAAACFLYSLPVTAIAGLTAMFRTMGWEAEWGVGASVAVCTLYTMGGGLWADSLTDTVQFVLMSVSMAVAIPLALDAVGGFAFLQALPPGHLTARGDVSPWLVAAWIAGSLTVFVEPAFYQRIVAARDGRDVRRALLVGIALWAAYDWAVTLLGMAARAAVAQGLLPGDLEGKQALVGVCLLALPVGLKGLFVAGILAAAMSSVDSYALLAAGNLSYDVIRPLLAPRMSERALIRLTRIGVLLVMAAGALISLAFDRISDAWVFMASVLVSALLVPVLGALFSRPRAAAGLAGCAAGLLGMATYYALVYARGAYDPGEETWVWKLGRVELWREYAVLFALPVSGAGFLAGHALGGRR